MSSIRKYRGFAEMTQEQLAEAMSVSKRTVSFWESGRREPVGSDYVRLAQVLKCDVRDLLPNPPLPPKRRKFNSPPGAVDAVQVAA